MNFNFNTSVNTHTHTHTHIYIHSSKEAQNSAKEETIATSQAEPEQPPQTLLAKNQDPIPSQESPPENSPSESPQESPKIGGKKISPSVSPKSSPKVGEYLSTSCVTLHECVMYREVCLSWSVCVCVCRGICGNSIIAEWMYVDVYT